MTQEKNRGLRLRQREKSPKKNRAWLLRTAVGWSTTGALLLTIGALTGVHGVTAGMLVTASYLCVVYGLLLRGNREQWFFPGVLLVALVMVIGAREQVLEGFRLYWNQMGQSVIQGTGWVLPEWKTQLPEEQSRLCLNLFAGMAAGAVTLLCCGLAGTAPQILAVLLPGTAVAAMTVLGERLTATQMIGNLTAAMLSLLYSGWEREKNRSPVAMSWCLWGLIGAVLVLPTLLPGVGQWAEDFGEQTRKAIHVSRYETEHTTLPEGDFREYRTVERDAEVALAVTMDTPESMYLRGFTGDVLEGNRWKAMDRENLAKERQLLYWLNLNCFTPNTQFAAAAQGQSPQENHVTVQNLGGCSRYRYVPFHLCADETIAAEDLRTEGLDGNGLRVDTYTVVSEGESRIADVLHWLQTSDDEAVLAYRKAESGYRGFVYRNYLQVPEEAVALLGEQWDALAARYGGVESLNTEESQACVLAFLSQCFPETGTPETMALPLDVARGTSYQYATVAVLTLRYFGIPARYAEGYRITEQMASSATAGQPLTVDSSSARAWAEVYQDGIGWIPMNVTPGLGESVEESPEQSEEAGDDDTENPELEPEKVEEDTPREQDTQVPDSEGGSVVSVTWTTPMALLPMILLILGLVLLWLRRRYQNHKRTQRFQDEDTKKGVGWIFADTVGLLEAMGFNRGNGSVRCIQEPTQACFGEAYGQELETMIRLNDRALFSSRPMEEDQRQTALDFRKHTLEQVRTKEKWYRRLWLKWIRCLY